MEKKRKKEIEYDYWQQQVLDASGDICVCAGRQTGKSLVVSHKAGAYIASTPKKHVLIVSTTEDQSQLMIVKILDYLLTHFPKSIKKGKDRPTKHMIKLTNGSTVRCKAVGVGGVSIRGFTIDMLIADEAAFMPEDVWAAITPMLLTTGGNIILISTPYGKKGYFYESYTGDAFKTFHVNSVDVMKNRHFSEVWNERHREMAVERLERERKRMTENQFAQEYLGQFVDDIKQFFSDELIQACMDLELSRARGTKEYYLGVDVARLGGDESTFEVLEKQIDGKLNHIHHETLKKVYLTATTNKVLDLDTHFDFRKVYIDDGGLGVGVFDPLLEHEQTKRKVVAINNNQRLIEYDPWKKQPRRKKLLKVDLYNNLRRLMEQGKISLMNKSDVWMSFKSVQFEFFQEGTLAGSMKIYGDYTHIVEGLIRAAWCDKQKTIKPYISYI